MSFIWPVMLVLLILVPLFILLYLRLQRRRKRIATSYGNMGMTLVSGRDLGWRRHIPIALFLIGLTILLIALARPQTVISLPRIEGIVMLTFDVSGSMAADDLKPTRMEAAKEAARQFVLSQPPTVQIGVVSFSDSGFTVQVPTNEQEVILATIDRLKPERGTSLGNGILMSLEAIAKAQKGDDSSYYTDLTLTPMPTATPVPRGTYTSAAIVLLTDGENTTSPDPLEAAQAAVDRGVRIHTVGIGSAAGSILEIEGYSIRSQLDEEMLQQISRLTDGTYYNAENEQELIAIYNNLNPQLVIRPEEMEITAVLTGLSIIILLIGAAFSLVWFSRLP
jgi:Ca-activated chloride channel family protein